MPGCDSEPIVSNAKAVLESDNETVKVTFECLNGFYMSGPARLVCNRTVNTWDIPPTCKVIYQGNNFYNYNNIPSTVDVWWCYLLAGVLSFMALVLIGAVIWCCCCSNTTVVYPYTDDNSSRICCCKKAKWKQDKTGHRQQNDHKVNSTNSEIENSCSDVDRSGYLSNNIRLYSQDGHIPTTNENRTDVFVVEIPSKDVHVSRCGGAVKDVGRKNKIWLPHTHGVRNNKTSTK